MILTVNGGSSSIKFALFSVEDVPQQLLSGSINHIGAGGSSFVFNNMVTNEQKTIPIEIVNHQQAAIVFIDWLHGQGNFNGVTSIGHRIVLGMERTAPEKITTALLDELREVSGYDPEHLPAEIGLIEIFIQRYPNVEQVGCFDSAFHATMPPVAKMFALPRRYYEKGIRRYGFHGLSFSYLLEEFAMLAGKKAAQGKIILAHLGSGASLAAVKDGQSLDTSMGFTPAAGLPMSTRCGDIDPGIAWYLMQFEKLDPDQFNHLVNHESGLLGISEKSPDMQELLKVADIDHRAAESIEFFCYQTKKWIGSFAAVLGGLETLIIAGGIGEHSPEVRSKICDGLEFLGIELCEIRNMKNEAIISSENSKVTVRIIKTNEELMIATLVRNTIRHSSMQSVEV